MLALASCGATQAPWATSASQTTSPGGLNKPSARDSNNGACFDSLVLVAIDGVRSEDIFNSPTHTPDRPEHGAELPHLQQLKKHGFALGGDSGARFFASGPNFVSLPGYMEMLSGTSRTGCTENDCSVMKVRTLLDDFLSHFPHEPSAVISSWPKLATAAREHGRSGGFVSAGHSASSVGDRLGPRSRALLLDQVPETGDAERYRHDQDTAHLALTYLDEHQPRFLFVSLGDTDERAHHGDRKGYWEALVFADELVGQIRERHRGMRAHGQTTALLVTTDHGRAQHFTDHGRDYPESARSFLLAEGTGLSRAALRRPEAEAHLRDIAPTIRGLCGFSQPPTTNGVALIKPPPARHAVAQWF